MDATVVVLDNLDTPNGVAWKDGDLYVSGFDKGKGMIWKVEDIDAYVLKGEVSNAPMELLWSLCAMPHHENVIRVMLLMLQIASLATRVAVCNSICLTEDTEYSNASCLGFKVRV